MAYLQYVRHLEKTSPAVQVIKKPGTVEHFAKGYQDYLQAPLQVNGFGSVSPGDEKLKLTNILHAG